MGKYQDLVRSKPWIFWGAIFSGGGWGCLRLSHTPLFWMLCLSGHFAPCTWCQSHQHEAASQPPHPCQGSGDQDWCSAELWAHSDCCGTSREPPPQQCRDWSASLSRAVSARLNAIFPCPLQAALYFQLAGRSVCWVFPLGFPHPWLMVLPGLNPVCCSNTGDLCWLVGDHI